MSNVPKNMTTFIKQGMIDFDYDGKKFRGTYWFNKETIHLHCRYKNPGTYKIFIKITDIFDNETTRILTVTIPSYKRETKKLKLYVANTMTYEELVKAIEKHTNYKETYLRTLGKPELEYLYNDTILKDFPKKFNKETTTKKVVEKKEPVKKPAAKKKVTKTPEPEPEQKKYRDYYYVDVVYFTPAKFKKLDFLYETTLPNKKDKAYCYMSADENSDEYNFYLFFNKNRQEAYQISSVQMLNFNDPSDKERKERADRFTDIAAKLYKEKNKIETSETTKKVSKKTPVKKSTTKISNPKDYPTLMAMRVKEKIIKDHNRCDFTKEEIEEAVDLSIRRGNETQGQIVKDAINILFATSKGH